MNLIKFLNVLLVNPHMHLTLHGLLKIILCFKLDRIYMKQRGVELISSDLIWYKATTTIKTTCSLKFV